MTIEELNALAHHRYYLVAKSDIENIATWRDDRIRSPTESVFTMDLHRWYDLSTRVYGEHEREALASAIFYLDGRSLLRRKSDEPFMVQVLPELSNGALVPPTLEEVVLA